MRAETLATASSRWRTCAAVLVLIAFAAGTACAQNAITGISVSQQPDRVIIKVQGNWALKMTPLISKSGSYLGFQFPCKLTAKGRLVGIRSGRIYNVRYSNFSTRPMSTRVVINSRGHLDYSTVWSPDRHSVEIHVMKQRISAATKPVAVNASPVPGGGEPATEPASAVEIAAVPVVPAAASVPAAEAKGAEPTVRVMGMAEVSTSGAQEPTTVAAPVPVSEPVRHVTPRPAETRQLMARAASAESADEPGRKVSLNFLGADINDVLKALAVQSGYNIVSSKDVTGNVTVSLNNVGVEEALDYIAKLSGYTYTRDRETYLVAQKGKISELAGDGTPGSETIEFVWLQYANGEDVQKLLASRLPSLHVSPFGQKGQESKAKTQEVTRTSLFSESRWMREVPPSSDMLALSGTPGDIAEAKQLIAQVEDSIRQQKEAARKWIDDKRRECYRVRYANPEQLAETIMALVPSVAVAFAPSNDFSLVGFKSAKSTSDGGPPSVEREFHDGPGGKDAAAAGATGGSSGPKGGQGSDKPDQLTSATNARTLVIVGEDSAVAKALEVAGQLDVKAPQVKIDAKITSITESGEKKLGFTWTWGEFGMAEGFTDFGSEKDTVVDAANTNKENVKISHKQWFRQPFNFSAALDALVTSGDGKVLASPSMTCLERNPGVFFVGDEVTYIQRIETTATGQNILTDTKRVGVQLLVVPESSSDGYVTLYLRPEVSTLTLSVEQGVTLPVVSSRFTDHVVRVKDGETIVIGGLIRNDEVEQMTKIPIIGDLPILGQLFRHKSKTNDHTEVVMFITASVLKD